MIGLDAVFARKLDQLVRFLEANRYRVVISDGVRSREAQRRAWERYQAGQGPLAAPPGRSCHEFGAAADLVVSPRNDAEVARAAQAFGLRVILYAETSNHVHVEDERRCRELRGDLPAKPQLPYPQDVADAQRQKPPASPGRAKGCP